MDSRSPKDLKATKTPLFKQLLALGRFLLTKDSTPTTGRRTTERYRICSLIKLRQTTSFSVGDDETDEKTASRDQVVRPAIWKTSFGEHQQNWQSSREFELFIRFMERKTFGIIKFLLYDTTSKYNQDRIESPNCGQILGRAHLWIIDHSQEIQAL